MGCYDMYCCLCGNPLSGRIILGNGCQSYTWMENIVYLGKDSLFVNDEFTYDSYGRVESGDKVFNIMDYKYLSTNTNPEFFSNKAVHRECWNVCSKPKSEDIIAPIQVEEYENSQNQHFNIIDLDEDKHWMLSNPSENIENANRIKFAFFMNNKVKKSKSKLSSHLMSSLIDYGE